MSDILADYREWASSQPASVSTHSDVCHMYHTECMVHRLARRLEEATLTDAEREAVALMAEVAADPRGGAVLSGYEVAATLRGLLERTLPQS